MGVARVTFAVIRLKREVKNNPALMAIIIPNKDSYVQFSSMDATFDEEWSQAGWFKPKMFKDHTPETRNFMLCFEERDVEL
jgi:hypothetical protein